MTDEEFRSRWMVIAYNRVDHQGEYIDFFASDNTKIRRLAYGRNGVGRHALVCFDEHYTIETWKDGTLNAYQITVSGGNSAFSIEKHTQTSKSGNGTKIYRPKNIKPAFETYVVTDNYTDERGNVYNKSEENILLSKNFVDQNHK